MRNRLASREATVIVPVIFFGTDDTPRVFVAIDVTRTETACTLGGAAGVPGAELESTDVGAASRWEAVAETKPGAGVEALTGNLEVVFDSVAFTGASGPAPLASTKPHCARQMHSIAINNVRIVISMSTIPSVDSTRSHPLPYRQRRS